jgi:hypothetical protein|tara:strand:+ start:29 stop:433 length:405 start_codon:yes stop_codon:yes gene_type:complete
MAKRRKPTKREMKEAKKLLNASQYTDQSINSQGHLIAKNPKSKVSITVSLKDGSNLVEHVRQQIDRNFKDYMLDEGLVEFQKYLRETYPAYKNLTVTPVSTKFKRIIDKKGDFTGTKGQVYYKWDMVIDYFKED